MANENRLIDAIEYCRELYKERDYPGRTQEFMDAIEVAIADLGDMPTVDAVEVVHGYNIRQDWPSLFECSICHWSDDDTYTGDTDTYNYCPHCGAKMDGDGNG